MSDLPIVERLKSPEVFIDVGGFHSPVAHQAADAIDVLVEALERAESALQDKGYRETQWPMPHIAAALDKVRGIE